MCFLDDRRADFKTATEPVGTALEAGDVKDEGTALLPERRAHGRG